MVTTNGQFVAKQLGQLQLNRVRHYVQKHRPSRD